ncbi:ribonuclease III [Miniphocaeibacter massiliensis]|uniref:ribonuclease III n=1 Tax=Miniphocaeibacter massiliensis TaxID=2041841 RepID=UPI000C08CD78|nr:ribonuclease III [Miniphocaeibacter massiliensis]
MNLENDRIRLLKELENDLEYKFNNIEILDGAFHHISIVNEETNEKFISNERMEFLGDSVLGLVFGEYFYKKHKDIDEGELTKLKSKTVCEDSFANAAKYFKLGNYLILGKGEEKSGGRNRDSILSDTFEALCAAIYLDSSYDRIYDFITNTHINIFNDYLEKNLDKYNYKAILQNYIQTKYKSKLKYRLDKESGPDHDKTFYVTAIYDNNVLESGKGKNKKTAEQEAAKNSIEKLGISFE